MKMQSSKLRGLLFLGLIASVPIQAPAEIVIVNVFDFDYSTGDPMDRPEDAVIQVGDTVRWRWQGGLHSVTAAAGQDEAFSSAITSTIGFTFDHTFTHSGVFWYYCVIHGADNGDGTATEMAGTVTVMSGASSLAISSAPQSGLAITVSPADNNGQSNGVTPFQRTYNAGENVMLTAPTRTNRLVFCYWTVDGAPAEEGVNALEIVASGNLALEATYAFIGDMDGDGLVTNFDIDPWLLGLSDPDSYALMYPELETQRVKRGDCNGDGSFDNFDVDPFVLLLGS